MKGTIKRVFLVRGFAFIHGDDGLDYFFQVNELRNKDWDGKSIYTGARTEFTPDNGGQGGNGLRATEVKVN